MDIRGHSCEKVLYLFGRMDNNLFDGKKQSKLLKYG